MVEDERYRPDAPTGPTGANAGGLGSKERKRGGGEDGRDESKRARLSE